MAERSGYIHSANLNAESDFPFLILHAEREVQTPMNPGFHVMHWHEDLQLLRCFEGEVTVRTLSEEVTVPAGDGLFINKNAIHLVRGTAESRYSSLLFPEYFVSFYAGGPAARLTQRITESQSCRLLHLQAGEAWSAEILRLMDELLRMQPEGCRTREHCCYQVLTKLAQLWAVLLENAPLQPRSREDTRDLRMRTFLQYIEEHYGEEISVGSLAASAGVSDSEALRCFRSALGTTPGRYLMDYRLAKAVRLLEETELPVGRIAEMTGFRQQSYFGKCFREKMGCSPGAYRKR